MSLIKRLGRGLKNNSLKILSKLSVLKGSPQSIADGFATGAAVSFTPFVGFHIIISLMVAKMLKQNGVAAVLGTIIGNPWTFPFIWWATLHTGNFLLYGELYPHAVSFTTLFKELFHMVITLDFNGFISDIYPVFMPMLIGSIPFYIVVWYLFSKLIYKSLKKQKELSDDTGIRV